LFTAQLALRSLGYLPETKVLPDPGQPLLVARVNWGRRAAQTGADLRCREGQAKHSRQATYADSCPLGMAGLNCSST